MEAVLASARQASSAAAAAAGAVMRIGAHTLVKKRRPEKPPRLVSA